MIKLNALAMLLASVAAGPALAHTAPAPERNIFTWPMPETFSPESPTAALASAGSTMPSPMPPMPFIAQFVDSMQKMMGAKVEKRYGVRVETSIIAGVPVRIIYPKGMTAQGNGAVPLNPFGGAKVDSGSLTRTIPMTALTGMPVAVLCRLSPENPYPARLDDALAANLALEQDYEASKIAVYGTSARAVLSEQFVAKLTSLRRPMPAVLASFSGSADTGKKGKSESWMLSSRGELMLETKYTVPLTDLVLSSPYSDLSKFPATLLVDSTRDLATSGTSIFAHALFEQGVQSNLIVSDGLFHAFWTYLLDIPETHQANAMMAKFLKRRIAQ